MPLDAKTLTTEERLWLVEQRLPVTTGLVSRAEMAAVLVENKADVRWPSGQSASGNLRPESEALLAEILQVLRLWLTANGVALPAKEIVPKPIEVAPGP